MKINNNSGFTLIEFLIAIVILMVGLLGMLSGIDLAMHKNVENSLRNEAVLAADDLMMASRALQFNSLSTSAISNPNLAPWVFDLNRFPQSRRYVRGFYKNYSVQRIVNSTTPQTKEVIITVAWHYKNKRSTHAVSSFVSTTLQ